MTSKANTETTLAVAASGRATVRYVDPVSNKPRTKRFRTEQLARVWIKGHVALASYWRNSAAAKYCDNVAAGNVKTIYV